MGEPKYPRLLSTRLSGDEEFKNAGNNGNFSIKDYWSWAHSNLVANVERGALAEYLVATALGISSGDSWRDLWTDSDLIDGKIRIEVKSASYIQDWDQPDYSKIKFAGLKGRSVFDLENRGVKEYKSDIYVFCLQAHKDHATFDILNLDQWRFWVFTRQELFDLSNNAASISLKRIEEHGHPSLEFAELAASIRANY